ncbi:MAG: SUMF1/EgtB/PvdOfamily nonheme iron enzyme [Sedimenticola thiotaurini]|uniref:SUMF1/EgtB/PvdOfamily nonheme iron enzyme n=1 Tax=Sedimenticola thiotaurini TaxID=1543721 RepID=A0A558D6K6_9GAMM|nr:MAG: SUMF1/EgtB/PvdOfamily nonheme iron enzyme [Sedimenticola thiotaurini]
MNQKSDHALKQCRHCSHKIEDPEALFCAQCGQSLCRDNHCCVCGKHLQPRANFCDRCGTAVSQPAKKAPSVLYAVDTSSPTKESVLLASKEQQIKEIIEEQVKQRLTQAQIERSVERSIQKEKAIQAKLLKYGLRESDWVGIAGGTFLMGSPLSEQDRFSNELQHPVEVERFEILKSPVTFAMYDIFCDETRRTRPPDDTWGRENRPVINVTYWNALEYCHWLSKRTEHKVRLPTEAEWEFACRAGTQTPFWTGEQITTDQANFDGNYTYAGSEKGESRGKTTPVDQFPPNPWGLHDMHGNVWEWCSSIYDENYTGLELKTGNNPDDLRERIVRGGSWHNVPSGIRSAIRNKLLPHYHYLRVGFRIARDIA